MPTADVVLRPDSTVSLGSTWSVQGAGGDADLATRDDSDATYLQTSGPHSTSKAVLGLGDIASPAGSKIEAVRVRARIGVAGGSGNTEFVLWVANGFKQAGWLTNSVGGAPIVSFTGPWWTTWQDGTSGQEVEFTDALLDGAEVRVLHATGAGAPSLRVAELYVDVDWNERPAVALTGPATPVTDTSRPTITWDYTDPEGDAQAGLEVRVYLESDEPGGGWPADPDDGTIVADPIYSSGDVASSNPQHQVDTLDNDLAYRVYVRVRQVWAGAGTHWSLWDHDTFTLDLDAPPQPVLVATADPATADVTLDVSSAAPGAGEIEPGWYQVQADYGDGWVEVRGATIDGAELVPDGARDATVIDHEAPLNVEVSYRARGIADVDGEIVAGPWSTTKLATLSTDLRWLTDPLDPDKGGRVGGTDVTVSWAPAREHVHVPADTDLAVVESEPVVRYLSLGLRTLTAEDYGTVTALLATTSTLLYRDRRDRLYVRLLGARNSHQIDKDAVSQDRQSVTMVEVARPAP